MTKQNVLHCITLALLVLVVVSLLMRENTKKDIKTVSEQSETVSVSTTQILTKQLELVLENPGTTTPKEISIVEIFETDQSERVTTQVPTKIIENTTDVELEQIDTGYFLMLKDVGEPFLEHFGLEESDFKLMSENDVSVIEGNFDICASDEDVLYILDTAETYGMSVVLPAGSGEAEWGYKCDVTPNPNQKPLWSKELVQKWVQKWKDHPALYGWDTSNEAGGNFPNVREDWENDFALTVDNLERAYSDVKEIDSDHPILIRMNGWYFYDNDSNFFREGNPFGPEIADIVMINTYSNVEDYYDDFVLTVATRATSAINKLDDDIAIILALGAWTEPPLWYKPSTSEFNNDMQSAKDTDGLIGIAVYKYGAKNQEWWMPQDAPNIWSILSD